MKAKKAPARKQLNNTINEVEHELSEPEADSDVQFMWLRITDSDWLYYDYEFRSDPSRGHVSVNGPQLVALLQMAVGDRSKVKITEHPEQSRLMVEIHGHLPATAYSGVRL